MRILSVITPSRLSGAERVLAWLSRFMQEQGHEVIVAIKPIPEVAEWYRSLGLDVRVLPISGKMNLLAARRLRKLIESERIDVVHTHLSTASLWGSIAARMARVPVVSHVHALNTKTCFRFADRLIAVSQAVKRHLENQGVPGERIEVVWPINPAVSEEPPPPAEDILALGDRVVSCLAHLSHKKGQHVLLAAAERVLAEVPDARFVIAGSGPLEARLRSLAERFGDSVVFTGFRRDATAIMRASRVSVLPSIAKEGFSLALQEAQAVGTPVVASDISGVPEHVEDGFNGFLVPPGDADALADRLILLLTDNDLREEMSRNCLKKVREISFEKAAQQCLDILEKEVIRKRG